MKLGSDQNPLCRAVVIPPFHLYLYTSLRLQYIAGQRPAPPGKMSSAEKTYHSLLDFGIEPALAKEASKRYVSNVEAAVDWCFGTGSNVSGHNKQPADCLGQVEG
jgi:hypothetical protein